METNFKDKKIITFTKRQKELEEFMQSFPDFFYGGKLKTFTCIYCPIAILEVELLEHHKQEFDSIEQIVLQIFASGFNDVNIVGNLTGIPIGFINKVKDILEGYGHIYNNTVTELGYKSLKEGKRLVEYTVKQFIQVEALTGTVLDKESSQSKDNRFDISELDSRFICGMPKSYIEKDVLSDVKNNIERYKNSRNSVINMNVKHINSVISREIFYTNAFIAEFEHLPHPILLMRNKTYDLASNVPTFKWKPVCVSKSIASINNIDTNEILIKPDNHFKVLEEILEKVHQEAVSTESQKAISKYIKNLGENVSIFSDIFPLNIEIKASDRVWNRNLIWMSKYISLGKGNIPYSTLSQYSLTWLVCYFYTQNEEVMKKAELYKAILAWNKNKEKKDIFEYLQNLDLEVDKEQIEQIYNVLNIQSNLKMETNDN